MPFIPVTSITGVPTTGTAGMPITLTGTVNPSNATNQTIVWRLGTGTASGASLVNGQVNATGAGTVVVIATIARGTATGDYTQTFTINFGMPFIPVTRITGVPTTGTAGTPITLTGTVNPSNATNQTIVWRLGNASTAPGASVVDGQVNAAGAGTVLIMATIADGTVTGDYTQTFTINFGVPFIPVTSITRVPTTGTVGTPITLTGTVYPLNATNQTIEWSLGEGSTAPRASVHEGYVNVTGEGTVVVTATIINGTAPGTNYTQNFTIHITPTTGRRHPRDDFPAPRITEPALPSVRPSEPTEPNEATEPTLPPILHVNPDVDTYNGNLLQSVTDRESALAAVQIAINNLPPAIMDSPDDLFTFLMFVEEAISLAASIYVDEGPIFINRQTVNPLIVQARDVEVAMQSLLTNNGITPDRQLRSGINFKTRRTADIQIVVEPSAGHMQADQARVMTSGFSLTFTQSFIKDTCTNKDVSGRDEDFVISDMDFTVNVSQLDGINAIKYLPKHPTDFPIILELQQIQGDRRYQHLVNLDTGQQLVSIYNEITGRVEGQNFTGSRIGIQGTRVRDNQFFDDIVEQDRAVIDAINQLSSQGVLEGVGGRRFNPNSHISRAEIAVIISKMSSLPQGSRTFTDVPSSHWAFDPVRRLASTANPVILAGTTRTTFSPNTTINRAQLVAIAGRCLQRGRFSRLDNPVAFLSGRYADHG
jgi:uncharacterized protein YjdB